MIIAAALIEGAALFAIVVALIAVSKNYEACNGWLQCFILY